MISWHRFYDPTTGRYISADPIGLDGGMNLYAYVKNNPISNIDTDGLFPTPFNGFCYFKYRAAKNACGSRFEEARVEFMNYLNWCECAWNHCRCGMEGSCGQQPTEQDCQKFDTKNSASSARISCIDSPEGSTVLKYGTKCIKAIASLIKCGI